MPADTDPMLQKSVQVAEASRERAWAKESFLREVFLGRLRLDLVDPYPRPSPPREEFLRFYRRLESLLRDLDSVAIDESGEYPEHVLAELRAMGAFGMKIPLEYGGLGFSQREYCQVMQLLGSADGNLAALISAHQSIGVPRPLELFGTEAQRRAYLPRCARGEISGFALTETEVGSDPAQLATTAEPTPDGRFFILNGAKLWCTNGTLASLLVVMARNPRSDAISAFVVETAWPGVAVAHRCRFMGLRALANGELTFRGVRVPRENLIGEEGRGLKIALTTLNTGRLSLPAASVGTSKLCLEICRKWSQARIQWGAPIGRHEAIAHKLAEMASTVFAMESLVDLVSSMADRGDLDIRLEAAAAKEWNTTRGWEILDETLQIRGGRGYETERSLAARGELPVGVERALRDSRINRIFEGSSEIMHLFMAREAVDKHLAVAGPLIDPRRRPGEKAAAMPRVAGFYGSWYPKLWAGWGRWPRFGRFGALARHLRFVERKSRKLAREVFHAMVVYRGATQRKQAYLFRLVDISNELFAMAAAVSRARMLAEARAPEARQALELADLFCRLRRRKVRALFHALWHNDDRQEYRVGRSVSEGRYAWIEAGIRGLGVEAEALRPPSVAEVLENAPFAVAGALERSGESLEAGAAGQVSAEGPRPQPPLRFAERGPGGEVAPQDPPDRPRV
jgi:alkylation response protein AidB-like acyl-CoA dehydrogenase